MEYTNLYFLYFKTLFKINKWIHGNGRKVEKEKKMMKKGKLYPESTYTELTTTDIEIMSS